MIFFFASGTRMAGKADQEIISEINNQKPVKKLKAL